MLPGTRTICRCPKLNSIFIKRFLQNKSLITEDTNLEIVDLNENLRLKPEKTSVLEQCKEDLSHVAPYLKPTFNFAAYVNNSVTLQEFLKLGVNLHELEKMKDVPEYILRLDFDRDVKKYVQFLYDVGLNLDVVAKIFTKNPVILREDLDDLEVRVNYLKAKKFTNDMILRILSVNPFWLSYSTQDVDNRLGFFQKNFHLTGNEVRSLTIKQPKLITYEESKVRRNIFVIREEMGFTTDESKSLLLKKPNLYMKGVIRVKCCNLKINALNILGQNNLLDVFEYVHRTMNIGLEHIVELPEVLLCRKFRIEQRYLFLKKLGKIQFDTKRPGYISLLNIISGNDVEFCQNVAKCSMDLYNTFLKTL